MATDRRIGRAEAAAIEPKPPVGGATFAGDGAALHDAKVTADNACWARRCVARHARDEADFALLCGVLGIGET